MEAYDDFYYLQVLKWHILFLKYGQLRLKDVYNVHLNGTLNIFHKMVIFNSFFSLYNCYKINVQSILSTSILDSVFTYNDNIFHINFLKNVDGS